MISAIQTSTSQDDKTFMKILTGYAEQVKEQKIEGKVWYISHNTVYRNIKK